MKSATLEQRLEAIRDKLSPAALRVATFLMENPHRAAVASASEIAREAATSDATVIRVAQSLGYAGLPELRRGVSEEWASRSDSEQILKERVSLVSDDPRSMLDVVFNDAIDILSETRASLDQEDFAGSVKALANAQRIVIFGIGRAGALAEYMTTGLTRIGCMVTCETHSGFRLADTLAGISSDDVVLVLAPILHAREIDVVLECAYNVGATRILASELLGEKLRESVDHVLSTASSRRRTANDSVGLIVLLDALLLGVAAANQDRALRSWAAINQLRATLTGGTNDLPHFWPNGALGQPGPEPDHP